MSTFTITGNDTLTLNDHVFNDLSNDDVVAISFPNELVNMSTGKNGNTLIALNPKGFNASCTIKCQRASNDDQFLNAILAAMANDLPSTTLLSGTFVKRLGNSLGVVLSDTYTLSGGVIKKIPDAKDNEGGDVTQAEVTYTIQFANAGRGIG